MGCKGRWIWGMGRNGFIVYTCSLLLIALYQIRSPAGAWNWIATRDVLVLVPFGVFRFLGLAAMTQSLSRLELFHDITMLDLGRNQLPSPRKPLA